MLDMLDYDTQVIVHSTPLVDESITSAVTLPRIGVHCYGAIESSGRIFASGVTTELSVECPRENVVRCD